MNSPTTQTITKPTRIEYLKSLTKKPRATIQEVGNGFAIVYLVPGRDGDIDVDAEDITLEEALELVSYNKDLQLSI